jgi:anti-anti-sigma regulatory factor
MKRFMPNAKTKKLTETVIKEYREVFGAKSLQQKLVSQAAALCALKESITLKFLGDVRQPKTIYTKFHRPAFRFFPETLKGKTIADLLPNMLEVKLGEAFAGSQVCLELHGILDSINVEKLRDKITGFFEREKGHIVLNLVNVQKIEDNSLYKLVEQLEQFHSRIKLQYSAKMEEISMMIEEVLLDFDESLQCVPAVG